MSAERTHKLLAVGIKAEQVGRYANILHVIAPYEQAGMTSTNRVYYARFKECIAEFRGLLAELEAIEAEEGREPEALATV